MIETSTALAFPKRDLYRVSDNPFASTKFDSSNLTPHRDPEWWARSAVILSGSVGMGHTMTARAIASHIGRNNQGYAPPIVDAVELMPRLAGKIYSDGYLTLARRAPSILGKLYAASDAQEKLSGLALTMDRLISRKLEQFLTDTSPDVVISTHFLPSRIVGALKAIGRIDTDLIQVITDFDAHAYWMVPETSHYCVAAEPAKKRLLAAGVAPELISITGIPLRHEYSMPTSKSEARTKLKLEDDAPVILVALGGHGANNFTPFVKGIMTMTEAAQVVVICGRNKSAKENISEFLQHNAQLFPHLKFTVLGFTDAIHTFMAAADLLVTKPGGITSSEALAIGLPIVVISPVPGQEEHNAKYLLENGVAVDCPESDRLGVTLDELIAHPETLSAMSIRAKQLGRPDACSQVTHRVSEVTLRRWVSAQVDGMSTEAFFDELAQTSLVGERVVFDLDNTLLVGDSGDELLKFLDQTTHKRLKLLPCIVDDSCTMTAKLGEGPAAFYSRILASSQSASNPDAAVEAAYLWLTKTLSGMTIADIERATAAAWQQASREGRIGIKIASVETLGRLMSLGARPAIVSATNQATVSWIIRNVVNPNLAEFDNEHNIQPDEVFGVSSYCEGGSTVRELLLSSGSREHILTAQLHTPTTAFGGKRDFVLQNLSKRPFFVAGDSANDFAMLATGRTHGWVVRGDKSGSSDRYVERFPVGSAERQIIL